MTIFQKSHSVLRQIASDCPDSVIYDLRLSLPPGVRFSRTLFLTSLAYTYQGSVYPVSGPSRQPPLCPPDRSVSQQDGRKP